MRVKPVNSILDIAPYKGGESSLPGFDKPIKLASNENPLGASPAALAAYRDAAASLPRYPDGHATVLRAAIAKRWSLDPARLVCGAGSDEIFALLARAYLAPGDEIVQSQYAFLIYAILAQTAGAAVRVAADKNLTVDVDAMLARMNGKTRLVFIANPNNPTGTYVSRDDLRRLAAGTPPHALLVIDSAYAEFAQQADYTAGADLVDEFPNVVMTRTFSKAYGLAALRIGWAYAREEVIDVLGRIRAPFNVSTPAQLAGAAAMADVAFVDASIAHNSRELKIVRDRLIALGLEVTPSVANFLLVHFPDAAGRGAADADAFLRARGFILRRMNAYGFPHALRLSIGTTEQNEKVLAAFADFAGAGT
jgi:histidinol-phosphate aminotransferase